MPPSPAAPPVRRAVGRAPGRVNLIGEHTDYNDGLCLPAALPYVTTVTATRRDDARLVLRSGTEGMEPWSGTLDDGGPGRVEGWAAYAAGVVWALRETGRDVPGLELDVVSDVPLGAGLSSSAALEAAVAVAVTGLLGETLGDDPDDDLRAELVDVCRRAEGEVVGAPTGGLDQTASLRSVDGGAVLIDFATGEVSPVDLGLAAAGARLLVVDTRVTHALSDGAGYGDRRRECERAAAALGVATLSEATLDAVERLEDDLLRRRARHVVTENARVQTAVEAFGSGDLAEVGRLFAQSHASMRDDFEISCPELDLVVEAATAAGALGARMTGGGFGGSAVLLVAEGDVATVRADVDAAFADAGFGAPAHLDGTPSRPAYLVRSE